MNLVNIIFYSLEVVAAAAALGILLTRNVFYGVLLLIVCLLSLAGIYVVAFAEFVAVTQVLVYVGGVLVLIIFGIMLTAKISGRPIMSKNRLWFIGVMPGSVVFLSLTKLFSDYSFEHKGTLQHPYPLEKIGALFMTEYLLPFEVIGVLLLIALIAAAITASLAQIKLDR
jgi:NADH-quinone oxidoreductase subunit J